MRWAVAEDQDGPRDTFSCRASRATWNVARRAPRAFRTLHAVSCWRSATRRRQTVVVPTNRTAGWFAGDDGPDPDGPGSPHHGESGSPAVREDAQHDELEAQARELELRARKEEQMLQVLALLQGAAPDSPSPMKPTEPAAPKPDGSPTDSKFAFLSEPDHSPGDSKFAFLSPLKSARAPEPEQTAELVAVMVPARKCNSKVGRPIRWLHLRRTVRPCPSTICTGTRLNPPAAAQGLGSPLSHLYRDRTHPPTSAPGLAPSVLPPYRGWLCDASVCFRPPPRLPCDGGG
jgi:hypothetical protein